MLFLPRCCISQSIVSAFRDMLSLSSGKYLFKWKWQCFLPRILSLGLIGMMVDLLASVLWLFHRSHPSRSGGPDFNPGGRKVHRTLNANGFPCHICRLLLTHLWYCQVLLGGQEWMIRELGFKSWLLLWGISHYLYSFDSDNDFSSGKESSIFKRKQETLWMWSFRDQWIQIKYSW